MPIYISNLFPVSHIFKNLISNTGYYEELLISPQNRKHTYDHDFEGLKVKWMKSIHEPK